MQTTIGCDHIDVKGLSGLSVSSCPLATGNEERRVARFRSITRVLGPFVLSQETSPSKDLFFFRPGYAVALVLGVITY